MVRLDLAQEAPGAAANVEQPPRPASGESRSERHQRLAPHDGRGPAEQHLDLMIIASSRRAAQIPVALKMEILQIIERVAAVRDLCQPARLGRAVPPPLDGAQVSKEISGTTQRPEEVVGPVRRGQVVAGLDISPVLLDQSPEVTENAPRVWHRPSAHRLRQWNRTGDARRQELLAEKPGYARGLRSVKGEPVQSRAHRDSTYSTSGGLQGSSE